MKSDVLTIDSAQYDQKRCCDEGWRIKDEGWKFLYTNRILPLIYIPRKGNILAAVKIPQVQITTGYTDAWLRWENTLGHPLEQALPAATGIV